MRIGDLKWVRSVSLEDSRSGLIEGRHDVIDTARSSTGRGGGDNTELGENS